MNYTNHTQDHSVDIQKLTQEQKDLMAIVIVIVASCWLGFFFYLARSSRAKKIKF